MTYGIYAMRDAKVGFMQPILEQSQGSAIRNFDAACRVEDSMIRKYPSDFSLWRLGYFDSDTGKIEPELPEKLIDADNILYGGEFLGD